jgi:hypothetical protein
MMKAFCILVHFSVTNMITIVIKRQVNLCINKASGLFDSPKRDQIFFCVFYHTFYCLGLHFSMNSILIVFECVYRCPINFTVLFFVLRIGKYRLLSFKAIFWLPIISDLATCIQLKKTCSRASMIGFKIRT